MNQATHATRIKKLMKYMLTCFGGWLICIAIMFVFQIKAPNPLFNSLGIGFGIFLVVQIFLAFLIAYSSYRHKKLYHSSDFQAYFYTFTICLVILFGRILVSYFR